jgi:hypothetical protein
MKHYHFSVICVTNGLLLLTILHDHSFRKRKEMLIVAGLAGADVIYGVGSALLPAYHLFIVWQGELNEKMSMWDCVALPPTIISYIGGQLTTVMNVVVSIDRFMSIAWPIKYRSLDKQYAIKILVSAFHQFDQFIQRDQFFRHWSLSLVFYP